MPKIPREKSFDSTLALRADPYRFISRRCERHGAELFETRVLLRDVICMKGRDAAKLFYDTTRFRRSSALPMRIQKVLFGTGGIQTLDGPPHRHRKEMYMGLMAPERIAELGKTADEWLERYVREWTTADEIVLYDEMQEILCRVICQWAGVPLPDNEVGKRTADLVRLYSCAGDIGPRYWIGRRARHRSDQWIERIVGDIRTSLLTPREETAASVIAHHRDPDGDPLPQHVAAVELLSVLRPTVAVSVFITYLALALHQHPQYASRIAAGESDLLDAFVQETRRFFPFFPAVVALARETFTWKGYKFPRGCTAVLDLFGTNRDPDLWQHADEFQPERFLTAAGCPFSFIPQGGGDYLENHRCPGEWITIELMKVAARFLTQRIAFEVPEQDLSIDWRSVPALPSSGFVMRNVKLRG